ncbi:hypothetical protein A2V49_01365 [candidate division WWE3 bacterium RBG_19FT_COMBO_34_6]|uniref:Serine dehydrogenase proteinase n=1 Tax=candidate division WWE3 bacterium RBG_19FT_COMBO_34_6 TaxID=1802612 RepID=A0A1F4UM03_UNCKA|nr:MAG: hypothetical protein A2V49_01365 [candidate division WWE3 bacterium RBG_19FT_COMBO_34_6]
MNEDSNQTPTQPLIQQPAAQIPPSVNKPPTPATATATKLPYKMPPLYWDDTQNCLNDIEKKLGGPVISFYTTESIVGDDVKYFYTNLKDIGFKDKLFFILVSYGGDGKSAFRIASLLKNYCSELIIVIPEVAASAATMLSLAGDKIIMTPLAYLTAVDTSITHPLNPKGRDNQPVSVELEEVKRAVEVLMKNTSEEKDKLDIYKTIFSYIHPVSFGALERTSTLSEMLCQDIISLRKNTLEQEKAAELIENLNHKYPAHGYPITRRKAKLLGLPIEDSDEELNNMLWRLQNTNRVLTTQTRTDINDSFFHTEKLLNSIESVGRRITCRRSMERRLDPIIKGWTTLKEDYFWEALTETEDNGKKKLKISSLEV